MTTETAQAQIRDLANTLALQADALANRSELDPVWLNLQVSRILTNAQTLRAWVPDIGEASPVSAVTPK